MITFSKPMYWGEHNCIQPTDIANTGYVPGDNPAAEHENYFRRQTYLCLQELQSTVRSIYEAVNIMLPYVELESGNCGEGTEYSLCADGTLHITGVGNIDDRAFATREDFGILDVNIGGNVGAWAFAGCKELNEVKVNCTKICDEAFLSCPKLNSLTIGRSVIEIGSGILTGCAFYIPSGVRVMYAGTIAEWNAITKADDWVGNGVDVENNVVICSDGEVEV